MGRGMIDTLAGVIAKLAAAVMLQSMLKGAAAIIPGIGGGGESAGFDFLNPFGFHGGGIVTKGGPRRYHGGGMVMRPDEVPAILQVGEQVIPKGGAVTAAPVINFHNEGPPMQVTKQTSRMENGRQVWDYWLSEVGQDPEKRNRARKVMGLS